MLAQLPTAAMHVFSSMTASSINDATTHCKSDGAHLTDCWPKGAEVVRVGDEEIVVPVKLDKPCVHITGNHGVLQA